MLPKQNEPQYTGLLFVLICALFNILGHMKIIMVIHIHNVTCVKMTMKKIIVIVSDQRPNLF